MDNLFLICNFRVSQDSRITAGSGCVLNMKRLSDFSTPVTPHQGSRKNTVLITCFYSHKLFTCLQNLLVK